MAFLLSAGLERRAVRWELASVRGEQAPVHGELAAVSGERFFVVLLHRPTPSSAYAFSD